MIDGWERVTVSGVEENPEKPGKRWELSPELGIEAFNFNVAVLDPGDRLSGNHFHYHENQRELFYVVEGTCRVETGDERFDMGEDEAVVFAAGEEGAHVIHNPYEEPCRLVAIGWPPEGRYPVHQLAETQAVADEGDPRT